MCSRKLGGRSGLMKRAVVFAESNGFECEFRKNNHLAFYGCGGRVIAPGTPRSEYAADRAIQRMRQLMRH